MWLLIVALFTPTIIKEYTFTSSVLVNVILTFNWLFILYFWLNGTKDVIYVVWYYINKKRLSKYDRKVHKQELNDKYEQSKVALLYCTCNDFNGEALAKCLDQDHINSDFYILDDSTQPEYIVQIDKFVSQYTDRRVIVVRRKNHKGFKAGNLNNWLKQYMNNYDYFVILDSDEVIPDNFVTDCLKFFQYYENCGIVQCNHVSTNNVNKFMELFHIGVNSHWPTYQTVKHNNGFMSLLGHGAMVSKECVINSSYFDEVVAEDLVFTIKARMHGYMCAFNISTVCQEEYPIDYLAFKKRHRKWTEGNMEFIKQYTLPILRSNMNWYEKLDIFLFTYNLPLTAFFSLYVLLNISIFPLLDYKLHYPWWLIIPTIIFFIAPMANDFITYTFTKKRIAFYKVIWYMFNTFILYGSMFYISLQASFLGFLGKKAIFHVTPKDSKHITFIESIKYNKDEIIFGIVLSIISFISSRNITPVLMLITPSFLCLFLTMYSNVSCVSDAIEYKTSTKVRKVTT